MKKQGELKNSSDSQLTSIPSGEIRIAASSFEAKIKKRLEEQNSNIQQVQQKANDTRFVVLQTMNAIRRAFNEIAAMDLGSRFILELEVNDLNGWPRLELGLLDNQVPDQINEKLIASVQNRNQDLFVELRATSGKIIFNLEFDQQKYQDYGLIIKKCIRQFLDEIENFILNPPTIDVTPLHTEDAQVESNAEIKALNEANLFNDEITQENSNRIEDTAEDDLIINFDK